MDYQDRAAILNVPSLIINALFGIGKLILGVYLLSGWFIIIAVYYLLLCAAKAQALYKYTVAKSIEDPKERHYMEHFVYKRSGTFLCLLGLSYLLVCLRMYFVGDVILYRGSLAYLVATIAFSKLGFAISGFISKRHLKGPIVTSLKMFSFTDAMVSIVVTQYTLLAIENPANAISSSAMFGMGCSVLFCSLGVYMLLKKMSVPLASPKE